MIVITLLEFVLVFSGKKISRHLAFDKQFIRSYDTIAFNVKEYSRQDKHSGWHIIFCQTAELAIPTHPTRYHDPVWSPCQQRKRTIISKYY